MRPCSRSFHIWGIVGWWTPNLRESGNILLMKSGILGFAFRNPTDDWNPESRIQVLQKNSGIQCLESGIHGEESRIQDCPGFPYMRWRMSVYIVYMSILHYTLNVRSRGKQLVFFSRESWCFPEGKQNQLEIWGKTKLTGFPRLRVCPCCCVHSRKRKLAIPPCVTPLSTMFWSRAVVYPEWGTLLNVSWSGYIKF